MTDSTQHHVFVPKINSNDHGAKVVICGALILPPVTMMAALSIYNRARAKSLLHLDGLVTLLGTFSAVATYATFAHATNLGFGKHTAALTDAQLSSVRATILAALLMFFISQGLVMVAYNMLARKTARSNIFFRSVDVFSTVIAIWSLANVVVVGRSLSTRSSPPYTFLVASAILTTCIWVGQLSSFLWIVWNTHARLPVKIRWSISLGLFIPACLGAVVTRLIILPRDLFVGDWTFTSINTALVFVTEVLFSVMNLLAPNLPVFFDQTSTGGLHFVPGNTPRTTQFTTSVISHQGVSDSNVRSTRPKQKEIGEIRSNDIELSGINSMFTTSARWDKDRRATSFDSEAILVRRSVEVS